MKKIIFIYLILLVFSLSIIAQTPVFSRQDTLRGSITPERSWWDLTYYHLKINVSILDSSFTGENIIQYSVLKPYQKMQIDLQPPLEITRIVQDDKVLSFEREGNVYWVYLDKQQHAGAINQVHVHYAGRPQVSHRPPWEGGIVWAFDNNNKPFIASTCQGDGASLWWPCKDHMYDEPDSMLMSITVPEYLTDVSNGRLRSVEKHPNGTKTFHWFVSSPINNYGVNINIGDYVHFSETYQGENGILDCDYYVLPYNLEKAKKQFKDVSRMLDAFEYWFGPYPFYEDGYKLVEAPYSGMEHQSSVTYGNGYTNGYKGRDVSHTGWGFKFDFIIIHESGHEWFANSITYRDIADMWVHESFIAYSENLFLNYHYGIEAAEAYVQGTRENILNDRPIVGYYNVNHTGSKDMYYKGENMLHTLRQIINDDEKWRSILRGLNKTFYHQTVSGKQIEDFINAQTSMDLNPFFDQYLRETRIPIFEYTRREGKLFFRWSNCVPDFNMPVKIRVGEKAVWLYPATEWKQIKDPAPLQTWMVDKNFYVAPFNLSSN